MHFTRRSFIQASFAVALAGMLPKLACASLPDAARRLHFYNTHTGESLKTVYWEEGAYNKEALQAINRVLRDHRTGDMHPIDPRLLDMLATLHRRMGSVKRYEVISGYRSPKSNAMLHERTNGVAANSLHMYGRAIDIRLTDRPLSALRSCALDMRQGGVGYYPASRFVHVDTGSVKAW
jgi:uncharacterized protein YcbK (DUF882 family)